MNLPKQVLNNGSLYLHVFLSKSKSKELNKELITSKLTSYTSGQLTHYVTKKAPAFKLLNKNLNSEKEIIPTLNPVTHWNPRITIDVVSFAQTIYTQSIPSEIFSLLK